MTMKGSKAKRAKSGKAAQSTSTRLRFIAHVIRQKSRYVRKAYRAQVLLDYKERTLRKSFKRARDARAYAERVSARLAAVAA